MNKEKIYKVISRQKTALISFVDKNGYSATKASIQLTLIEENNIYFATYAPSRKMKDYRSKINVVSAYSGFLNNITVHFRLSIYY